MIPYNHSCEIRITVISNQNQSETFVFVVKRDKIFTKPPPPQPPSRPPLNHRIHRNPTVSQNKTRHLLKL